MHHPPEILKRHDAGLLIQRLKETILQEWETCCRERVSAARQESRMDLRDSLPAFLDQLVVTLNCVNPKSQAEINAEVAREHGTDRANQREYTLDEMIYEYHLLRLVLISKLETEGTFDLETYQILHEFLDRGIRKASVRYVELEMKRELEQKIENDKLREQLLVATQAAIQKLEEERELRERFVDTLTHDLRTPMTAARITAQFLSRKADDPIAVKNLANRIIVSIDRAERMIRDLLDANRIKAEQGIPVDIQECNLVQVVETALNDLHSLYGARFKWVKNSEKFVGYWDAEALQRVIENLVGNAVKYGEPNTEITITLSSLSGEIELSVHNHGTPIPLEEQKSLFNPFRRTESAIHSGQKGWGLGLTLVKAITDALHGSVRVVSKAEEGTTFYVRLPLDSRASP